MKSILDIHTHRPDIHPDAIVSTDLYTFSPEAGRYYSVGIHPWKSSCVTDDFPERLLEKLSHPQVVAVGETGIDRLRGADIERQTQILEQHILLSEKLQKPLILHVVKAFDIILRLHKQYNPQQRWIIHGFRNNASIAQQLLQHGIDLSFGEKYNAEALVTTPIDRLWVESDESSHTIWHIYSEIAQWRICDIQELQQNVSARIQQLFFAAQ